MKKFITFFILFILVASCIIFFEYDVQAVNDAVSSSKAHGSIIANVDEDVQDSESTEVKNSVVDTVKNAITGLIHKHEYEPTTVDANCTEDGFVTYTCKCGDTHTEKTADAFGHRYVVTVIPATCSGEGYTSHVCNECGHSYIDERVEPLGHSMPDEWVLMIMPTADADGVEVRICDCGYEERRTYVCTHSNISEVVVNDATCKKTGLSHIVCNECNKVVSEKQLAILSHSFGNWETVKRANPNENGEKRRSCACGEYETAITEFKIAGNNSIYIESANINVEYIEAAFSQKAVDTYDVICNYSRLKGIPIILGHNTGSLKKLYNTTVGSYIYFFVDGELTTYKVTVSEKANETSDGKDIEGLSSGRKLLFEDCENTLRLYTCYKDKELGNIRWLVIAEKMN